jgi:16S rRNA (cytidine1402-2'-O)-methyltransferase
MDGTLFLVATPIGNLEDMTFRAVRVLKEADLIACEDTRTSAPLLRSYGIRTPVTSYHKFNEEEKSGELIGKMLRGGKIALITDAGMPAISDPGCILVRKCMEQAIPVTAVPGASACVTALALSGADTRRFVFEGFLPVDNKEKKEALSRLSEECLLYNLDRSFDSLKFYKEITQEIS